MLKSHAVQKVIFHTEFQRQPHGSGFRSLEEEGPCSSCVRLTLGYVSCCCSLDTNVDGVWLLCRMDDAETWSGVTSLPVAKAPLITCFGTVSLHLLPLLSGNWKPEAAYGTLYGRSPFVHHAILTPKLWKQLCMFLTLILIKHHYSTSSGLLHSLFNPVPLTSVADFHSLPSL